MAESPPLQPFDPATHKALVVFDVETTGLNCDTCNIISVSASCNGKKFNSFVNPLKPIPEQATAVNGITDADVANAPTWATVGKDFLHWIFETAGAQPILCAYNGTTFDLHFLLSHNFRHLKPDDYPSFTSVKLTDPIVEARMLIARSEGIKNYKQATLYEWLFGEPPNGVHTSSGDVAALERIVQHELFRDRVIERARVVRDITGAHYDAQRAAEEAFERARVAAWRTSQKLKRTKK